MKKVEITIKDIESTKSFKKADEMVQNIYRLPFYIKAVAGWVTVAKYKGLDHMLNIYHMDDFKRAIVKELFETKVSRLII